MFGAQENRAVWDVPASATLLQCRGSLGEDGAILSCLDPRRTMPGDSCRAGRPRSLRLDGAGDGGGAGGWQLPSSTKSLMLESAESSLSTRILLGRTACAASGLAGPLVHRHFFQHVSPAHERLGILARGRAELPLPLQGRPSHSPLRGKGNRLGLSVRPKCG